MGVTRLSHFYNRSAGALFYFVLQQNKQTMKTKLPLMMIGVLIIGGWILKGATQLKEVDWLIGTWESRTPKGSMYESWTKVNDTSFSGKSFVLNGKDTIVSETIQLVEEQNSLVYIPTVKKQNGGLPVRFPLKTLSESSIVFENLQHDFPQVISYTKYGSDSLVARISGSRNGQNREQSFGMKRIR